VSFEGVEVWRLPEGTKFSHDKSALANPVEVVKEFRRQPASELLNALIAGSDGEFFAWAGPKPGRPPMAGDWPALYLGYVADGAVAIQKFANKLPGTGLLEAAGFATSPTRQSIDSHFAALEKSSTAFDEVTRELMRHAMHEDPRIGVSAFVDSTASHSASTLRGLPTPNPYPSKVPPPDWQPRDVDLSRLAARRPHRYSHLQVLEAVHEFKLSFRAGDAASTSRYRGFARGRDGIPDLIVLNRHGGLAALLTELLQPDWREKARNLDLDGESERMRARAEAAERKKAKRGAKPHGGRKPEPRMRFLVLLRDGGPLPPRDLMKGLDLSRMRVWQLFVELEQMGFVEGTEKNSRSSNQRYRLTTFGREALQNEAALRELLARPVSEINLKDLWKLRATRRSGPIGA
jgi:DNA-binding MarR family transcriptional regulator